MIINHYYENNKEIDPLKRRYKDPPKIKPYYIFIGPGKDPWKNSNYMSYEDMYYWILSEDKTPDKRFFLA